MVQSQVVDKEKMLEGVGRKLATILQTKLGVASFDIVQCKTAVYY